VSAERKAGAWSSGMTASLSPPYPTVHQSSPTSTLTAGLQQEVIRIDTRHRELEVRVQTGAIEIEIA